MINIYQVNLESVDSGASIRTYDEKGTVDPSDDAVASESIRNAALGPIFNGSHFWLEYRPNTDAPSSGSQQWVPDANEDNAETAYLRPNAHKPTTRG